MPRLSQLAEVLIDCKVVGPEAWDRAVALGGRDLSRLLDELAAEPPPWWDGGDPAPPGLTDYQRVVIEDRVGTGDMPGLRRDLALNKFLLLDHLGRGGQGQVYRGRQLNPPRFVAIKTLIQDTDARRRRFEQEAKAMMTVRHPAVARFHLYERIRGPRGKPTDEYLIAMELVAGTDLFRLVYNTGPVMWRFAAHWAADLLGGLAEIHRHGFVHRDVKPENVIATGPVPAAGVRAEDTAAKLLDFGAVRPAAADGDPGSSGRTFVGTREYAPPEQWAGEAVPASDLYALGGTLFHVLTGRAPFEVPDRDPFAFMDAHATQPAPSLRDHNPDVPESFDRLYRRMMGKDPAQRGTAAELAREFEKILGRSRPAAPAPRSGVLKSVKKPTQVEDDGPLTLYDRVIDPPLAALERAFLPARLRPPRGSNVPFGDRVLALLRRPLVLALLVLLTGGLIYLAVR
jgi:serine/threonine protein kinase